MRSAILLCGVLLAPLCAQDLSLPPNLEALSSRARESVKVTLDGPLLQLAARMIPETDQKDAAVKKVVAGIRGIYVRSFEFDSEGEYSQADVDAARAMFRDPEWARIVGVKSRLDGDVDVYLRTSAGGKLGGVAVVVAEPREFTIVHVSGEISPEQLMELGGEFHIPRLKISGHQGREDH